MVKDTTAGYGSISILLHWLGAIAIVAIWLLGDRVEDMPRGDERTAALALHIAVAFTCLLVLVPRLLWRFANPKTPMATTSSPFLDVIAKIVKWGLLIAITVLIVSGPLDVWTGRRAVIDVFGLFSVPSPLPASLNGVLHPITGPAHVIAAKAILILVGLHVLGALKHLVIDRDGVFRRMLVPAK